jgi:hypothetical protein
MKAERERERGLHVPLKRSIRQETRAEIAFFGVLHPWATRSININYHHHHHHHHSQEILYMYSICALKSPLPKILCRQTNQTQQTTTRQSQHQPIYIALFYLFARNCTTAEDDLLRNSSERNLRKSKL